MHSLTLTAFGFCLVIGLAGCSDEGAPADTLDASDGAADVVGDAQAGDLGAPDADGADEVETADTTVELPPDAGDTALDTADAPEEVTDDVAGDAGADAEADATADVEEGGDTVADSCPAPVAEVAPQWLRQIVAGPTLDRGNGIALLPDGGFMLTGAAFNDPGPPALLDPEGPCPAALAGEPSLFFLSRHHPDGSLAWVRTGEGGGSPDDLALLSGGGVVLVGRFQGTITLGTGTPAAVSLDSQGKQDVFVARYDAGALSWAFGLGGDDNELALSIEPMSDGGFVIAGEYEATVAFGPGEGQTLTTTAFRSAFIARYSGAGKLAWVRAATGPGWSTITDLAVGPEERLLFVGHFNRDITWAEGEGPLGSVKLASQGGLDAMFGALAADGKPLWADSVGSVRPPETPEGIPGYEERGDAVAVAADGTIYVALEFSREVTLGAALPTEVTLGDDEDWVTDKLLLAACDPDGALLWARQTTASPELNLAWHTAAALVPLPGGGLIMGGSFVSDITLGPGEAAQTTLKSAGNFDHFLARFDASGALVWARRGGGSKPDYLNRLVLDSSPAVPGLLALGLFQETADMGLFAPPGLAPTGSTLAAAGSQDVFVGRVSLTAP